MMDKNKLLTLPEETLLEMWNMYMRYKEKPFLVYYQNNEEVLNFILENNSPYEIIKKVSYGDYNFFHTYFTVNKYGNLKSYLSLDDFIDYNELVKWINDNPEIVCKEWKV